MTEKNMMQGDDKKPASTTEIAERREQAVTLAEDLDVKIQEGAAAFVMARSGSMAKTLSLAMAVVDIKGALTSTIMTPLMSLQGTPLGFKTDKDSSGGYPQNVVKEATCEALIKGVPMVGNCVNIIAGRAYITKEGFSFLINELQQQGGVSKFAFTLSPPEKVDGRTLVHGKASWVQKGEPVELECDLPIKTNGGSTDDNSLGKAERKLKARCHERMTGLGLSDGDIEEGGEGIVSQADVEVSKPVYDKPAIPEKKKPEPKPDPKPAPEKKAASKPVVSEAEQLRDEIASHESKPYFAEVRESVMPAEIPIEEAALKHLKEIAEGLRKAAEA